MLRVEIVQYDSSARKLRSFVSTKREREVSSFIDRTRMAYNMARTRIYVEGKPVAGMDID
jgi:hypothetical protein